MNGKERIFAALRHEHTDSVPWIPFAGVHAGKLKGFDARQVLSDGDKLLDSLLEVNRVYNPDGQPVIFDLQIEAEILGCELIWADKAPPSVVTHPLQTRMEIPKIFPEKKNGRLPLILQAMRDMNEQVGDHTALFGLVTGPLTLASHLRGTEIFMDMFDHEEYLLELLNYCAEVGRRMSELYSDAGMHVIAVVDPVVSQISPKHFKKFLSPKFHDLFALIRQAGVFSSFFVCGDATKNIEAMCHTEPDGIAIDENIDLASTKQITDKHNITLEGNIPLTSHMLLGSQQDNMKYTIDLMDEIEAAGLSTTKNLIIAPGCDMLYDTPPQNAVAVSQAVHERETIREVVKNYASSTFNDIHVDLPDYKNLKKPLMEAFLLDPIACAACTYMLAAAESACKELGDSIDFAEYRYNNTDDIARMQQLQIACLPSIYINGELKYPSIIPSTEELVEELKKFI